MSNKSILIMNTPACCAGCRLCNDFDDDWEVSCAVTGSVLQVGAYYNRRMDDCPLISLEKVCKMAIDAYKEEEKIKKENTILCDECYKFFDKREVKTITEYSKWFTDVNKEGYKIDWRYVYNRGKCPHCGDLVLIDYHTESREV